MLGNELASNKKSSQRKLGNAQLHCLTFLGKGSTWRYGGINGWLWDTSSGTQRILDKLVERGLAVCNDGNYSISDDGLSYLARHSDS